MKKAIKKAWKIISNPNNEFSKLGNFESSLRDYLILLITIGLATGIVSFIIYSLNAMYLDIFLSADITYWRMLNYAGGRFTSIMFFYMFSGTFLLFILSLFVKPFARNTKYVHLLQIMFYSLSPMLLFSWIPGIAPGLGMWSIFLLIKGIRINKKSSEIKKGSLEQRE